MSEKLPFGPDQDELIKGLNAQAVEACRTRDADPEAAAVFEQWLDTHQQKIDAIYEDLGERAAAEAGLRWDMLRAAVYFDAGFEDVAIQAMTELIDATQAKVFEGVPIYEEARRTLDAMRRRAER